MIRLIRFLITGDWHLHEWAKDGEVIDYFKYPNAGYDRQFRQPCRCKHCGKIKSFKL